MNIKRVIWGPLLSFVLIIFFSFIVVGVQWFLVNSVATSSQSAVTASISGAVQEIAQNVELANLEPLASQPDIGAKAAVSIVSNLQGPDRIIFSKNINEKLPIASLTKLMTAVIVLDKYNLSENIIIDDVADSQDPMKQDVRLGQVLSVESLLEIMLVESSNKSAYALSELIGEKKFVGLMNKKALELGLQDTYFVDPTGLSPENVSTAIDLARFTKYILRDYPKIAETSMERESEVSGFGSVVNTDELLGEIPEIICSKTGFTTAAKGCLLLAMNDSKNNDYIINIILGADDRFAEMRKLINYSSKICQ